MPTFLAGLPSNPVTDFLKSAILGNGEDPRESYFTIKNLETGSEYKFQFPPDVDYSRYHNMTSFQAIRGDKPYFVPSQGGSPQVRVTLLIYKVDKSYSMSTVRNNLLELNKFKDGKLPRLLIKLPGQSSMQCYMANLSFRYPTDMVTAIAKDEPRSIEVEMQFVRYKKLPTPTTAGVSPASTAFYTSDEATVGEKAASKSTSKAGNKAKPGSLASVLSKAAGGEVPDMGGDEGMVLE